MNHTTKSPKLKPNIALDANDVDRIVDALNALIGNLKKAKPVSLQDWEIAETKKLLTRVRRMQG